jgi:hypothetical protein
MTIAVDVDLLRQLRLALPAEALDRFSQEWVRVLDRLVEGAQR